MIGDKQSKVLIKVDADTSGAVAGVDKLTAAEKKAADNREKFAAAFRDQISNWTDAYTKFSGTISSFQNTAKFAFETMEASARKAQLTYNTSILSVEKLRKGTGGLRSEMQLLEVANSLAHSKFKLTADQMEMVGSAMRELVREGNSWDEVTKKVTESIVKLEGDSLKDFTIRVREAKTDSEKFSAIIEGLAGKSALLTDATNTAAESIQGYQTKFVDAMDRIKEGIGRVAEVVVRVVDMIPDKWLDASGAAPGASRALQEFAPQIIANIGKNIELTSLRLLARYGVGGRYTASRLELPPPGAPASPSFEGRSSSPMDIDQRYIAPTITSGDSGALDFASTRASARTPWGPERGFAFNSRGEGTGWLTKTLEDKRAGVSAMERVFGSIDEMATYQTAFQGFNDTIQAGFSAWITGAESVGAAMKKMLSQSIASVASEMLVQSIRHAAYSLGYLAFGDVAGAGKHAASAAKFAAGAIVVGGIAKTLGGGGGGSQSQGASASPGGGVPAYSGGSNQGGQAQTTVIVYGSDFSNDSARQRRLRAAKAIEDARQANGAASYA